MGSQLSRVKTAPEILPPRIVIHSEGGAGKTTLGADVPGAIFLPVEEGLGVLSVPHFERPTSYAEVMQAFAELANEKHDYRALVIDAIDKVEPLIWAAVCESSGKKNIEEFGYGKGYTLCDPLWIEFFHALDTLRAHKRMTIVVLSHNERKAVDDVLVGPHERIMPKLHKRANALLYEWADVVAFLEIEKVSETKTGTKGRETKTAYSSGQRVLHLEDRGSFTAKNRYSLPASIEIPKEHPYAPLREAILAALPQPAAKAKKEAA